MHIIVIYVFEEMSWRTIRAMCNDTGTLINYITMARVNGDIQLHRQRLHLRASVRYLVCRMIITDSIIVVIRVLSLGARWDYCAS